jgi:hypothetical protein
VSNGRIPPVSARGAGRLGGVGMGERLGGFLYGTIVVLAVIVTGAKAYPHEPGHVAVLVAITTVVFWLAHVYAHALGHSVSREEPLSRTALRHIARHEAALIEAGVPSIIALLLGSVGVVSARTSYWLALGVGLTVLAADGVIFARTERLGGLSTVAVVAANLALGLVLVALKVLVAH